MDINATTPKADPNDAKALFPDGKPRWSSNTITYNFMPSLPIAHINGEKIVTYIADSPDPDPTKSFKPLVEAQKQAAEAALQLWADVANLNFERKEDKALQLADFLTPPEIKYILGVVGKYDDFANAVDRTAGKYLGFPVVEGADIRLGTSDQENDSSGFAFYPPENILARVEEAKNNFFDEVDQTIKPINDAIDRLNDANLINALPGVEVNLIPKLPTASKLFPFGTLKLGVYGDVFLNNNQTEAEYNQPDQIGTRGGKGFHTLIHEIGHALGLEHPGNYNAGGGGTDSPFLPKDRDSYLYSVMSYDYKDANPNIQRQRWAELPKFDKDGKLLEKGKLYFPRTPMLYDIAAIQALYGANFKTREGDDNYKYSSTAPFMETIWDGGGSDTIDASNQTRETEINLNAGSFSSIGFRGYNYLVDTETGDYLRGEEPQAKYNLAIAFGVTIENALGSNFDDVITGNSVSNTLKGGAGNDIINPGLGSYDFVDGEAGNDLLKLDYSVEDTGEGVTSYIYNYSNGASGSFSRYQASNSSTRDYVSFNGIERFEVTGSSKNDDLKGETNNDLLIGGAGNDTLYGDQGNDTIDGGEGNDAVSVYWYGDTGKADNLDGGAGIDTLSVDLSNQTAAITFDSTNPVAEITFADATKVANFEIFKDIKTGSGNDRLVQLGRMDNQLYAGSGDDIINPGLGSYDFVDGEAGNDLLKLDYSVEDTGEGVTSYIYNYSNGASGSFSRYQASNSSTRDYVSFNGIERFEVTGSSKNDDLKGETNNDLLIGGAGNDTLTGGGGADILKAGLGDDTYVLNAQTAAGSQIQDTGGTDILNFTDITLSLAAPSAGLAGLQLDGTTLMIDLNKDGVVNATNDLAILDFFGSTGTGTGFIETVGNLSGISILALLN
jgi:serralysin